MTDMKKLGALRRRARGLGTGHARRYPLKLRLDVVAAVEARRASGGTWKRLAGELDISVETLRRWWQEEERFSQPGLVPVDVEGDSIMAFGEISVVTPGGLRVEGLGVDEAARLIRALS